jgi:prefoldin beta subunit
MEMDKKTQESIMQLQMVEQQMQAVSMQKHNFQSQSLEVDNAIEELSKGEGEAYRILANVLVSAKREDLKKDLKSKKELLELRLKNLEKQETQLKEKTEKIREEVMKKIK